MMRSVLLSFDGFVKTSFVSALMVTLALVGCSTQPASDLAVDKLSASQMQETAFLPLNADKPGTPVDVQRYLVPGKYTIVAYFSPYWENYISLGAQLSQLVQVRNDIAVRTVNVNRPGVQGIDWQSPIVQNEGITAMPYFQIFDPAQRLRAHGRPAYEQIMQWVKSLPQATPPR